jgi:hypothetical protein
MDEKHVKDESLETETVEEETVAEELEGSEDSAIQRSEEFDEQYGIDEEEILDDSPEDTETPAEDEEPAEETKTEEPPESKVEETPKFDDAIVRRAQEEFGLTMEEVREFTPNALKIFVERTGTAKPGEEKKEKPKEAEPEDDLWKEEKPLDPDEYDEEIVERDKRQAERIRTLKDKIDKIESTLTESQQQSQQQKWADYCDRMDQRFNSAEEEYKEVFGDGTWKTMQPGTKEYENREAVLKEASIITSVCVQKGIPVPSEDQLFKRAVISLFPEAKTASEKKKFEKSVSDRQNVMQLKPTHRASKEPSGEEAALKRSEDFDKQFSL